MTIIRKNTNPRATDVAPQLQSVLHANGMQAHISLSETGTYQLVTISHNSSQPRYYDLNEKQLDALVNGGTNTWNKNAYNTFVSIVKDDYYIPGSWVAAKNANSPVNHGLWGHTIMDGEYGYRDPRFRPFAGPGFGKFDNSLFGFLFGGGRYHIRRVAGRPYFANSAPVVIERPDGRLKPGELKSGSYGFYDKGNQKKDALSNLEVDVKPRVLERPKGKALPLKDYITGYSTLLTFSGAGFAEVLSSHGIVVDKDKKTLTIKSDGVNKNLEYTLTDEELNTILNDKLRFTDTRGKKKHVHNKNAPNISERLDVINKVIANDFADKITVDHLQSKDYINIKLKPETAASLGLLEKQANAYNKNIDTLDLDMREMRQDYRTGFIDKWNSIGVVDGRTLSEDKGFYLPMDKGRRVAVGEIQAYPTNDGTKTSYRMTAVINNQVMSHEISKDDYIKFINYDDEHRLQLFDKVFDEVKIKSASNGMLEDNTRSSYLDEAKDVVRLEGDYSLVSSKSSAAITGAMAWKDNISGDYTINVRTNKDAGMWSFKITEDQYTKFKYATNEERAQMLTSLIPLTDENKEKMKVVESASLYRGGYVKGQNANVSASLEKVLQDLEKAGLGYKIVNNRDLPEQERFRVLKESVQKLQEKANKSGAKIAIPSDSELWQMIKEHPHTQVPDQQQKSKLQSAEQKQYNLNDLREQTKINLLGDASVNGESLDNLKAGKKWTRSGEHGRDTQVGDISVEKLKDAEGKVIDGKYKMTAVIDGNVFSHEITEKQYNKFMTVNNLQRMKLFDKIFPEVEMKTKPENRFNLGAALLAAVTTGVGVMAIASEPRPHHRPVVFESGPVFSKPGVVSAAEVSASIYESMNNGPAPSEGYGLGR
ncbi:hypothetical protein [Segatella copri]|uniref:Uncharacterized protein n=1 Tax=Segatella copri TaxID=165179 RepID=A0AA93BL28_9BACT|nr:hypothetical protein [Segatella copri]RHA83115.1 hypothetical protein DW916_13420 [Segatella copri]